MVARMNVSGTARPTVAPAPCGLMFTARLAPIAAMDSEIAPQVVSVRRSAGVGEPVERTFRCGHVLRPSWGSRPPRFPQSRWLFRY